MDTTPPEALEVNYVITLHISQDGGVVKELDLKDPVTNPALASFAK